MTEISVKKCYNIQRFSCNCMTTCARWPSQLTWPVRISGFVSVDQVGLEHSAPGVETQIGINQDVATLNQEFIVIQFVYLVFFQNIWTVRDVFAKLVVILLHYTWFWLLCTFQLLLGPTTFMNIGAEERMQVVKTLGKRFGNLPWSITLKRIERKQLRKS